MIILATVSINAVLGENGIISQAEHARESQRAATVKDTVSMWQLEKELAKSAGLGDAQTRAELLADLLANNLITESEKATVEETGTVTIAGQVINFGTDAKTLVEMYNAGELKIGDYVNYPNPTSGTYTSLGTNTGMQNYKEQEMNDMLDEDLNQVYNVANNQLNWRVLGIDKETGGLKLIAGSPMKKETTSNNLPYLRMYGAKAYTTGVDELDKICAMYKNNLATKARSVNIDDINEITGITTENKIKEVNIDPIMNGAKQYGDTYSYTDHYTPASWLNNKTTTTVSGTVDGYMYAVNVPTEFGIVSATVLDTRAYNLLFNNVEDGTGASYWLASRGVLADSGHAGFGLSTVFSGGGVTGVYCGSNMFDSRGFEYGGGYAVRPVIILKSEVTEEDLQKIDDQTEEIWNYGGR